MSESKMANRESVREQYADDKNLLTRIKLHTRYSTNPYGLNRWLFDHYQFTASCRILELGCGNGNQWEGHVTSLPPAAMLILSDLSKGMVGNVWEKFASYDNVLVQRIDIQDIPFPDSSVDVIIANHMLYHVPDLSRAIEEVHRVLKPQGVFYATTNGNGGMRLFLHDALKQFNPKLDVFNSELSFTLQNGKQILSQCFQDVVRIDYKDSLAITETQDLVDWIKSTITIASYTENDLNGLADYFEKYYKKNGIISIPKEAGLFIARK